ncbi:class F sortase [Streptomyces sp. NPDC018031]|uniref:class F sortase n=1 Tax=Streptomyces sp. NPDC018031 TaxID=3365033 RepID=UPI0037A818BC
MTAVSGDRARGGDTRLITGVTWAVLLLGLWLWGRGTDPGPATTAGDVAAVGRPPAHGLPAARQPLPGARPQRLVIESAGVVAPVVGRGLDAAGAVDPPPYDRPGVVGWYRAGPRPGEAGAALLVGHADTDAGPAVFHGLSGVKPGRRVRVERADGSVAEFTVEDVEVVPRDRFDAHRVYGTRSPGRAELKLITCGGRYDRARQHYTANVVVSAYLTGVRRPPDAPPAPRQAAPPGPAEARAPGTAPARGAAGAPGAAGDRAAAVP